jgi:site-specific recombinase XerD
MLASTEDRLPHPAREWLVGSGLDVHVDAYVHRLVERGYRPLSIRQYLSAVAHFSHWCGRRGIPIAEISERCVRQFIEQHLPNCRCARRCLRLRGSVSAALRHLVEHLRAGGHTAPRPSLTPSRFLSELSAFDDHLRRACGLTSLTRRQYQRHVSQFLEAVFDRNPIEIASLSTPDVAAFMQHRTAGYKPTSIKAVTTALRRYFRFKAVQGEKTAQLVAVLPRPAIWRQSQLPQIATQGEISRLLDAYDRRTATGKRDYAIARCLMDLGLRRTEVARLKLEDVDWREGVLHVPAKGRRVDTLPLPVTTGRAIVDYLRRGRPSTVRREIFVRHRPPRNGPADPDLVRNAIRCAAARCGLRGRIRGTHILRHTVAGRLVQAGAPLKQIADLLRHRDLDTTTIYAKVDLPALRRVAMAWPGRSGS